MAIGLCSIAYRTKFLVVHFRSATMSNTGMNKAIDSHFRVRTGGDV
jgi:hypothetical protein